MTLKYPNLLFLLLLYIPLIWYWIRPRHSHYASLGVSTLAPFKGKLTRGRAWLLPIMRLLEMVALGALIVALARPQKQDSLTSSHVYGTDIVVALDISESMMSKDIKPTRFDAAKSTAVEFIQNRKQDNIGLVIFAGEALSIMPLTNDLMALENAVEGLQIGMLPTNTAIGDGLVSAINRVLNGQATSKSIILITDGTNNAGDVDPEIASDIAKSKGIKVYTIGVGLDDKAVYTDEFGYQSVTVESKMDEATLKNIAGKTGGEFFRVTDAHALDEVFKKIDELEKTSMDVESVQRTEEAFMPWVMIALICFSFVLFLRFTVLTKLP